MYSTVTTVGSLHICLQRVSSVWNPSPAKCPPKRQTSGSRWCQRTVKTTATILFCYYEICTLHYIIAINVFKEKTSITLQELNAIEKMSFQRVHTEI